MEITNNNLQVVESGNTLVFENVRVPGNYSILYQPGSGLVTLRGLCKCPCAFARFRVKFTGNLKADISETISGVTLLKLALTQNGENVAISTMDATVGDTTSIYSVGTEILIDVAAGCCQSIGVKNITSDSITVDVLNANLIVERVA